jgi:NADPH-dependent curcumin reductase CurA
MSIQIRKLRAFGFGSSLREAAQFVTESMPPLAPHQVIIQNKYIGVNGLFDRAIVRNEVPYRFLDPPIDLGVEAIGVVIALGAEVKNLKLGDAVSTTKFGQGYRDFQLEDAAKVWQIPALLPDYIALRPTAVSALVAIEQVGGIDIGQSYQNQIFVVTAAAGGLGQFVVQFAKMAGFKVVGICGGQAKVDFLETLGCDLTIDYLRQDVDRVLKASFPKGVNVVYDTVGGTMFDVLVDNLAQRGKIIVSGYASDMGQDHLPALVNRPRIYEQIYWKAAQIRCFQNALYPEYQDDASRRILDMYHQQKITVKLDAKIFEGLDSIFDAVDYLCSGQSIGKVLIKI